MELNITKSSVCCNETVFDKTLEQGLEFSVNIPDYCGEVRRILYSGIRPHIASKQLSGRTLIIEGTAVFSVLYLDSDGGLCSYEYPAPFTKTVETDGEFTDCEIRVRPQSRFVNAKAVSKNRIDVHAAIELATVVRCRKSTEIVNDIDTGDVYLLKGESPATTPMSFAEKNMIIEEELPLEAASEPIGCILYYDAKPKILNHKLVSGKVIVKGELSVCIVYATADRKKHESCISAIPFSQIIDVEGVGEDCECSVSVTVPFLEIKPRGAYEGEAKSFLLGAKLCIGVCAVCNSDVAVVYDCFSSKNDLKLNLQNVTVEKAVAQIEENYTVKKRLDFSDGDVEEVICEWCKTAVNSCRYDGENLTVSGTVTVNFLALNVDSVPNFFERPIDFEYSYKSENLPKTLCCEPNADVVSLNYSIIGNNALDMQIVLSVSATLYDRKSIPVLVDVEAGESRNEDELSDCALVVYYAEKGEKVWDIAKKYCASPEEIKKVNSVSDTVLEPSAIIISC